MQSFGDDGKEMWQKVVEEGMRSLDEGERKKEIKATVWSQSINQYFPHRNLSSPTLSRVKNIIRIIFYPSLCSLDNKRLESSRRKLHIYKESEGGGKKVRGRFRFLQFNQRRMRCGVSGERVGVGTEEIASAANCKCLSSPTPNRN